MRRLLATAAGVMLLLVAGCGGSGTSQQGTAAPTAEPTDTQTAAPAGESVAVEHAMGTSEVGCTPQRVVTLGQGQTDTALALGVEPVGVVQPWTDEFYDYLPAAVQDAEVVGTELEPDLETIASLEPDVILGSKLRHEEVYDQLSAIAPTVFAETIGRAWKDNVSLWAEALCRQDAGDELLQDWRQRTAAFEDGLAELGDPTVSLVRFMPSEVRIYLTGFPGSVLRDVGLSRPEPQQVEDWESSEQLIEISEERIPDMDGDVIFEMISGDAYAQAGGHDIDETVEQWTSTDLWQGLSAVQAGRVHQVNEEHWNLGGGILAANEMLGDLENYFLDRS